MSLHEVALQNTRRWKQSFPLFMVVRFNSKIKVLQLGIVSFIHLLV